MSAAVIDNALLWLAMLSGCSHLHEDSMVKQRWARLAAQVFSMMNCWPAASRTKQDDGTGTVLRDDQRCENLDHPYGPC